MEIHFHMDCYDHVEFKPLCELQHLLEKQAHLLVWNQVGTVFLASSSSRYLLNNENLLAMHDRLCKPSANKDLIPEDQAPCTERLQTQGVSRAACNNNSGSAPKSQRTPTARSFSEIGSGAGD